MADNPPLFDGDDVIGIDWGQALADGRMTDVDALKRFADRYETEPATAEASRGPANLIRSAAAEILQLRIEIDAVTRSLAAANRKIARWEKAEAGAGLPFEAPAQETAA